MKDRLHVVMPSFLDELEAIQKDLEKRSFSVGDVAAGVKGIGSSIYHGARQVPADLGGAAAAFLTPANAFRRGWKETWHPGGKPLGLGWKAMMGYGALTGMRDVAQEEDPSGQGHSRLRRALRFAGDQAGGFIGAPYGLAGGMLAAVAGQKAGDVAGAAIDKLRGYRAPMHPAHLPPQPTGSDS